MDAATLVGVIFAIVRVAILLGIIYFAAVEVIRSRRKK